MTAFTVSSGGDVTFESFTGGSVVAALDTYAISNQSRLVVRTDTYACANHSVAFGSLDTVTFSGTGGTLHFDPTYVRVVAYTAGSGNSPAYGAAITQGAVSGVFLGAWTNWQSEPIVAGAAIGATGFIKIGGKTGGNFAAGALTGITATCSGADVQGWLECRGPDTGLITVPRIGKVTSTEAWFDLGTTTGARGQVLPCPTTATVAGVWPGVWIETAAGSGVYDRYTGVGSQVALATTRTDASTKVIWQTTAGIRIGNDGTNGVGYLPPTGCNVRIPATILTNCTRNATTGSGPRVLPNATIATRQELVTTGAGYFDLRNMVCQWYMNLLQPFYVKYLNCAINDSMILSEVASAVDVDNCIVSPTQAQVFNALNMSSCFAGGTVKNSDFWRFSLAAASATTALVSYVTGVTFNSCVFGSLTLRLNSVTNVLSGTLTSSCVFSNNTFIGARGALSAASNCTVSNTTYYDHTLTTTTTSTNPITVWDLSGGSTNTLFTGITLPLPLVGPYTALINVGASANTTIRQIGTSVAAPLAMNNTVTGVVVNSAGNCNGLNMKRIFVTGTRVGTWALVNSDTGLLLENVYGDYASTPAFPVLNSVAKSCGLTGTTTGQISVYGTHWLSCFTAATTGFLEILCNEPTAASAAQCSATGGTPQFNSSGSLLLTKVGDQVTWTMPFKAVGYTAFTNVAPTITGTNVTYVSGSTWGNHTLEFQIDTGAGYGSWLALTAANFIAQTITATAGFALKVRATCLTAAATNVLTNLRVAMTSTAADQAANLYPLQTQTLTLTGLQTLSDVVVRVAGSSTILAQVDQAAGTTWGYTYETLQNVDIDVIKPGYVPVPLVRNYPLSSGNSSLPVSQLVDRNYI